MSYDGILTVNELARLSGATPDTVRYYTRKGLLHPSRNPANGYRLYQLHDAKRLQFIRQAKRLGFTLNEIAGITHDADHKHSPCPRVRKILEQRIDDNRRQLNELMALQTRMEQALNQWEALPDGIPDGESVCYLIESFDPEASSQ